MLFQPSNWREMERLQREMNRLFDATTPRMVPRTSAGFPGVNVYTNDNEGVIITAELPGVEPENLNLSVTGDTLTLSGSRQPHASLQEAQYHRQERRHGEFTRTVQLPFSVNKDKVVAKLEKGILQISLPRAEAEKPRQIKVSLAN